MALKCQWRRRPQHQEATFDWWARRRRQIFIEQASQFYEQERRADSNVGPVVAVAAVILMKLVLLRPYKRTQ